MREIDEIQLAIGDAILRTININDWESAWLSIGIIHPIVEESWMKIEGRDGQVHNVEVPDEVTLCMAELRQVMHDPKKGTWYIAEVSLKRDGLALEMTFDYDSEPAWTAIRPKREAYEDDHAKYPRPIEILPAWHPVSPKFID
ncbi:hypothetical protein [Arthrobacter sp. CJ23]|uniref:hypothetical protein n=1 Tax=Arthrobacter sp. CJ23 TaxID=2972479 RepID=UPI00215C0B8E|nr:hypothetical protein [Arthrobacter sp. CJ23]UVJ38054.1 hypothetical protein NVV90_12365 [Arthrobacter sp. CJ23]